MAARGLESLRPGVARPSDAALADFWQAVKAARPDLARSDDFEVCCFGIDAADVEDTMQHILDGTKSATFRVPTVLQARGQRVPEAGHVIVLIDWHGTPRLALRYTQVEQRTFADITEAHTELEAPQFRDTALWHRMHGEYWKAELARFGLPFSDAVPILVGRFEVIHPCATR